jgi:hypothetical protein
MSFASATEAAGNMTLVAGTYSRSKEPFKHLRENDINKPGAMKST